MSPSVAPSIYAVVGSVCWGHVTGVAEDNVRAFTYWDGTGAVEDSGDDERLCLQPGEYMESEVVECGVCTVTVAQNTYDSGDTITMYYRDGATKVACTAAARTAYTIPFVSTGYVQVRLEVAA